MFKTITDADYVDDRAILANTPNQVETLLHSLEPAASLKLVDKFTYLGSNVSTTEKDIDTRLTKAWSAIDRLSIIWKSDLTDKIKRNFFQAAVVSILLYGCTTRTLTKRLEKKARRRLHKNVKSNIEQVLGATPHKAPTIRLPTTHRENFPS